MFVATVDVKVVATLDGCHVGIVVAVQKANANVAGVVGTKACRAHVLGQSSPCKITHDPVLDIHVGIDCISEASVWRAAVGETNQVDASLDSCRRRGDALLKGLSAIGGKVSLFESGEAEVGERIRRLGTRTDGECRMILVVVGKEAS